MDPVKLAKLQAAAAANRIGGKGTVRRKVVRKGKPAAAQDDKKLQAALKKMNVQPISGVEEVNMFREDGNVLHFASPKVHAAVSANTFAIYGAGHVKELTELVPGILNQLGPGNPSHPSSIPHLLTPTDSLASLRKLAESYQAIQQQRPDEPAEDDDDDVPDLVENFDDAAKLD
ncbi:nascent polypeptide-associated complex subunit beta [Armillaria novae-zelandiae]|uniref:Nascent polypeptide-associated complex subunit beta n=1 Tax=Armillaria novae-zelandiae TaxID=153914 RepID=A0AA39NRI6_9AGAR|nr:nascent polypeptide-associated complex subunit beta [Armillaria novae-zelandiae]